MRKDPLKEFMDRFRRFVDSKGWTNEGLKELLNITYLSHDPVSLSTVWKWRRKNSVGPSGSRLMGLQDFMKAHYRGAARFSANKTTKKPKRK